MDTFNSLAENAHQVFEARSRARDQALNQTRQLTRLAAHTIRAIHRDEREQADNLLNEAKTIVETLKNDLKQYPDLYYAGYTQDAIKEYAEAALARAMIIGLPLPMPEELGLEYNTYLNGLSEATGELRRRCMDILRHGYSEDAERLLACMDEIYALLVTMDYPDAITNGLRRQTDLTRGIVERTRADLTLSLREQHLQESLKEVSAKLSSSGK